MKGDGSHPVLAKAVRWCLRIRFKVVVRGKGGVSRGLYSRD